MAAAVAESEQGAPSLSSLLRPHAGVIAKSVQSKVNLKQQFQDTEDLLKSTNTLLCKSVRYLSDASEVEGALESLIQVDNEVAVLKKAFGATLSDVQRAYARNERVLLDGMFAERRERAAAAPPVPKTQHPFWTKYRNAIDSAEVEVEVNLEDGAAESKADLEVRIKCPITQTVMTKPMKNTNCGHTCDESALNHIFSMKPQNGKFHVCPVRGCKKPIQKSQYELDDEVLGLIEQFKKKEEKKKAGSRPKNSDTIEGPSSSSRKKKRVLQEDDEEEA